MPNAALTELTIRKLQPPATGQTTVWDSVPGFGIRVSQGGAKTFIVLVGGGNRRSIGRFPIISLSHARTEAKRILAERTLGKHRAKSIPYDEAQKLFLAECEQRVIRARTLSDYTRLLKKHFSLGRQQLSDITADDIGRRIDRIIDAPSERNHALVAVKVFLRWALKPPRRYIAHNPCEGMVPIRRPSRRRVLTDREVAAVYHTARQGEDSFSNIVALLILTGQRRGEIGALRREWINAKERTITLPASATKNGVEHTFPYGRAVASVLEWIPNEGDSFFPPSRSHVRGKPTTTFNGWPKQKKAFDAACGVSDWTLHDLRRTFATNLAALGIAPHVVERLLNHATGSISGVAAIYSRFQYMDEMRDAIARWEERLAALLTAT